MKNLLHRISDLDIYHVGAKNEQKKHSQNAMNIRYSVCFPLPQSWGISKAAALDFAFIVVILPQGEVEMWILVICDFQVDSCKILIYSAKWKGVKNRWFLKEEKGGLNWKPGLSQSRNDHEVHITVNSKREEAISF